MDPSTAPETDFMSRNMTVLFITSPHIIVPSTRLLEEVAFSLQEHAPGVQRCRKLVICDGFRVGEKNIWKQGRVTNEYAARYHTYLRRLHMLTGQPGSGLYGAEMILLQKRHGFAHGVRRGLMRVHTPYVLVAQHDRSLYRPVSLAALLRAMEAHSHVHNVGLMTGGLVHYEHNTVRQRYNQLLPAFREMRVPVEAAPRVLVDRPCMPGGDAETHNPAAEQEHPPRLSPLIQFSDSMHLARTKHYLQSVFSRLRKVKLHVGDFLEDVYGQYQVKDIREHGMVAHAFYGTYVYEDGWAVPMVGHLDGHDARMEEAASLKYRFSKRHTSEGHWAQLEQQTADEGEVDLFAGGAANVEVVVGLWDRDVISPFSVDATNAMATSEQSCHGQEAHLEGRDMITTLEQG